MAPIERAELELTATIAGAQRTGTFVFLGGEENRASIRDQGRTGYLLDNAGSNIIGLLQQALADDDPKRRGISFDSGGGQRVHTLNFQLGEGVTDDSGKHYQWGSSSDPTVGPNKHTATGADPRTQEQVFMHYWQVGQFDSRGGAVFRWWERSGNGIYSEWEVAIEQPTFNVQAGDPKVDGSMTLIDLKRVDGPVDATQQPSDR